MRWRWRRPRQRAWSKLVLVGIGLLMILILCEWRLRPALETVTAAQAHRVANEAIQEAVLENISGNMGYSNLMQPGSDSSGQVVFMQADTLNISRLQAQIRLAVEEQLTLLEGRTYYLPLGQILGIKILAAYGPPIPLRFIPVGTVEVGIGDTFEAAGINQTRHRIYLQIEGVVQVVAPLSRKEIRVANTIPVAEAIIVGPVPQTYVSLGSELINGILHGPSF